MKNEDLASKIIEMLMNHTSFQNDLDFYGNELPVKPYVKWVEENICDNSFYFHKQLKESLSNIDFYFHHCRCKDKSVFFGEDIIGFQSIDGFSFFGCCGGGEWEFPIYFIIYYDKGLRIYVPERGNFYNRIKNKAFGNDLESDKIALKKLGETDKDELEICTFSIREEIKQKFLKKDDSQCNMNN